MPGASLLLQYVLSSMDYGNECRGTIWVGYISLIARESPGKFPLEQEQRKDQR